MDQVDASINSFSDNATDTDTSPGRFSCFVCIPSSLHDGQYDNKRESYIERECYTSLAESREEMKFDDMCAYAMGLITKLPVHETFDFDVSFSK